MGGAGRGAEWGLAPLSGPGHHDLLEILDDRYARRGTLLARQIPVEHWHDVVGDPTFGDAILDRLLNNAHLRVKGRTTWYESVDEMQADLDAYIETSNRNRPHRGRGMEGRTPYQVLKKGIRKTRSPKKSTGKEVRTAA